VDAHTLQVIEFDRIREILSRHASCALGRQMAQRIKPVHRRDLIEQRVAQVREMIEADQSIGLPSFSGVHDIAQAVESAVPPHCPEPEDFAILAETFDATHRITQWAATLSAYMSALTELCGQIGDFKPIADVIHRVVDPRGEVRDEASAKLSRIRTEVSHAGQQIHKVVDRMLQQSNVTRWLQYPNATFHDDRLVLPVVAEYRGRIPGIVHRTSDSGATLFVEPAEAVELNNRIISLKADEQAEISRLLWHLTHQVHLNQAEILKTLKALAVLDLITAKVRMSKAYDLHCPALSEDGQLNLRHARHPLLLEIEKQHPREPEHQVVPIDVRLGDDFDILVITGPNTGGKTVALKTIASLCAMAQSGVPIPADEGSCVPIYRDIFVDIGDEQSLQQSLSTFSAHLTRLMEMLQLAKADTLLLIDELGAGTDPDEGAAIGRAILEELLSQRCPSLITTHLGVLKSVAYSEARAENGCVEFDLETLKPTFRVLIGEPGNSNAINIAQRLGLPRRVVSAARGHLSSSHQQLTRAIRGTLQSRRAAERARSESENAKLEAEKMQRDAERRQRALDEKHAAFDRWIKQISSLQPGASVHVKRFDRPGTIVRMMLHKQLAVVAVGAMEMEIPLRELTIEDIGE